MSFRWSNEYFGIIERYDLKILVLGPGDNSQDELMVKKRINVLSELQNKFTNLTTMFFAPDNVQNPNNWLPEVKAFAVDEADYVFCLISPSVSLSVESLSVLENCKSKMAVFYNSTEYESNSDLKTIIEALRSSRIVLQSLPSLRIKECHICSRVIGIVYRLLQTRDWA